MGASGGKHGTRPHHRCLVVSGPCTVNQRCLLFSAHGKKLCGRGVSMGDVAIRVQGLSKQYRIGKHERYRAFRDVLTDAMYAPFRRATALVRGNAAAAANLSETIWALKDVSFEAKKGQAIGII